MDVKLQILMEILPLAVLQPLTPEARNAIPNALGIGSSVLIRKFPFRIGRESRVRIIDGRMERIERHKLDDRAPSNDLYLLDQGDLLNISREHLLIDRTSSGYTVVDRGSACGTRVGETAIGGEDRGGGCVLQDGDIIAIGARTTPYLYRFISLEVYTLVKAEAAEPEAALL